MKLIYPENLHNTKCYNADQFLSFEITDKSFVSIDIIGTTTFGKDIKLSSCVYSPDISCNESMKSVREVFDRFLDWLSDKGTYGSWNFAQIIPISSEERKDNP